MKLTFIMHKSPGPRLIRVLRSLSPVGLFRPQNEHQLRAHDPTSSSIMPCDYPCYPAIPRALLPMILG
eukprot:1621973-Rhodomonas_salina.2